MKKTKIFAVLLAFILLTAGIVLMSGGVEEYIPPPEPVITEPEEPDDSWTVENELFRVKADNIWKQEAYKFGKGFYYLSISYAEPESLQESKVWVDFQVDGTEQYENETAYLDSLFGPAGDNPTIDRTVSEFQGIKSYCAELVDAAGYVTTFTVFKGGRFMYSIVTCIPIGSGKVQADIEKLMEDFVIDPTRERSDPKIQTEVKK